jgi:ribonuclease D
MNTEYIETTEQLQDLCDRLSGAEWLALDTEFMRESTYYPKLCLLQVGTPEITACIDPIALPDLDPFLDLMYREDIIKVMHAGGQDMEIFYHLRGSLPAPIFDTQVAAPLLGFQEQAGYARLVEEIAGVHLSKSHTRADWSHRPLSEAQIQYAADDVVYLCQVYTHLRDELTRRGRMEWLKDEFAALSDPSRYINPPEKAWRRVKATNKLRGATLSIIQSLAAWREEVAQKENRPRGWLIKDDVMVDLARQKPAGLPELGRIRGLNERTCKRFGEHILSIIQDAGQKKPDPLPAYVKAAKPTVNQLAIVDMLNAIVHLRAAEQELNPAQLAPRKALESLVMGKDEEIAVLQGWRKNLIGDELQSVLRGEKCLVIQDNHLVLESK